MALELLLLIINAMLSLAHFPSRWKEAAVVVVPKAGRDPKFPQSYRPISLLSNISKIAEAVVLERLRDEVTDLDLIPHEQFGFRLHHSADQQLLRVTEAARDALDARETFGAVFLDIAAAFDTVWHEGLIFKMLGMGVSGDLVRVISSYLAGRTFLVKSKDIRSTVRPVLAGVPQGSLLGPELFSIYVSDIPKDQAVSLAMYADDTAIFTSSRSENIMVRRLQRSIDNLSEWFERWKFDINADKCVALRVTRRLAPPPDCVELDRMELPWRSAVKYLGMHIDARLTFRTHMRELRTRFLRARKPLLPLLAPRSPLDLNNKLLLYKTFLRPTLTYAALSWCTVANTNIKIIETLQNCILRMIVSAPWFIRNDQIRRDLGVPSLREYTRTLAVGAWDRAGVSANPLIQGIAQEEAVEPQDRPPPVRPLRRPRDVVRDARETAGAREPPD